MIRDPIYDQTYSSAALEKRAATTPGDAFVASVCGFSTRASAQYIQIFDRSSPPNPGDVPILQQMVASNMHFSFDFGRGRKFHTGCYVANSTTSGTYTAGADDCLFFAVFRRSIP